MVGSGKCWHMARWPQAPGCPAHLPICPLLCSQGVVEFSLCLLFAKLVSYTFLYWLPLYISNVGEYTGRKRGERKGGASKEETHHEVLMTPRIGRISADTLQAQKEDFFFHGKLSFAETLLVPD